MNTQTTTAPATDTVDNSAFEAYQAAEAAIYADNTRLWQMLRAGTEAAERLEDVDVAAIFALGEEIDQARAALLGRPFRFSAAAAVRKLFPDWTPEPDYSGLDQNAHRSHPQAEAAAPTEYGVRWTYWDRQGRLQTGEKIFKTAKAREAFERKVQERDNFQEFVSTFN